MIFEKIAGKKKNLIVKSNGEVEPFDRDKLRQSLERSGASFVVVNEVTDRIESELKNKMTTEKIYEKAFEYLKDKGESKTANRYALRRGVLKLGPTGFPFEQFIAKILQKRGYKTKNGVTLNGKCVEHEVDVVAYDDDDLILTEIKFHNQLSIKTDTKVALYIKARYDDLREGTFNIDGKERKMTKGIMVTNTKFTNNAKKYARCVGMELISWDYPEKGNLYNLIEESGIDPAEFARTGVIK
jgi:Holliday junction resolvase